MLKNIQRSGFCIFSSTLPKAFPLFFCHSRLANRHFCPSPVSHSHGKSQEFLELIDMCGRARCTLRVDDISRACYRSNGPVRALHMDRYRPSYNVSPGSNIPVLRKDDESGDEGVVVHCMKWGLIPNFTKKTEKPDHYRMFNARSESVCEKTSFRRLIPKNRCLIAVEGFYEWKKDGSKKQPYYIHFKDGSPLVFAALFDSWVNHEGEILYTFTILTTSSSSALNWLHDRMPVILGDKERIEKWLNDSSAKVDVELKPYEEPDLVWYPVTPSMGKPSFDGLDCIKEIPVKIEGNNLISKLFSSKLIKKEQSSSEEKLSHDEIFKADAQQNPKEEPETEDKPGLDQHGTTSHEIITEGSSGCKSQLKRDYNDFLSDIKPVSNDPKKKFSPIKKKGNAGSSSDRQPTLFSYFGKR